MSAYVILNRICRNAFLFGVGDFWYEDNRNYWQQLIYNVYRFTVYLTYFATLLGLFLTTIIDEMPKEHRDNASTLTVAIATLMSKISFLLYHKEKVKELNRDIIKVCEKHEKSHTWKMQYQRIRRYVIAYYLSVYLTVVLFSVQATFMYLSGKPFITFPTYLPKYEDRSILAESARYFTTLTWIHMMSFMIWADSIAISHLIILAFKFLTLREYFEQLRVDFENAPSTMTNEESVAKLKQGFLEGMFMHRELLRLTRNIQSAFVAMISIQVCQSSITAVLILLRFAFLPEHTFTNTAMALIFIVSLFTVLALYMWNSGEVTYEASLLPHAMFYCGWHLSKVEAVHHEDIRRLVVLSCMLAQRPVVMKAFGVQTLSYETFLWVARSTYSVFAVFYRA